MKKLLCMILALIMVLSLCACGQKPADNNGDNNTNKETSQSNTDQNGNEPSAAEIQMMNQYKDIAVKLKSYAENGGISYLKDTEVLYDTEALQAIYKDLSDMEALDKWYGTQWMPKDAPETNWNRQALLSGFTVLENVLVKQNCVLTDRVGETEDYMNCFTWSYRADGKVESVYWNTNLFNNFIPYAFGLETEAFYDVVQRSGSKPDGMKLVYDEQGTLTEIKITGEVENRQKGVEFQFVLKYDANNKLIGADWTKYSEYSGNIKFAYDAAGRLAEATSEIFFDKWDNRQDFYTYNYSYDAEGNLNKIEHRAYDYRGELEGDVICYTFTKNSETETSGTVSIYSGAFCYYNKDKQKDQTNRDVTFTYDAQGRLIKAEQGAGALYSPTTSAVPYNKAVFEYVYGDVCSYDPAE